MLLAPTVAASAALTSSNSIIYHDIQSQSQRILSSDYSLHSKSSNYADRDDSIIYKEPNTRAFELTSDVGEIIFQNDTDADFGTNDAPEGNKVPISQEQFDQCIVDLLTADVNGDSHLSSSEFLSFITLNSGAYGYTTQFDNMTFTDLPLNYPLLFHTTACLCAFEAGAVDACCAGENAHVNVYYQSSNEGSIGNETALGGGNETNVVVVAVSEEEESYTRLFCTEVYYSYDVTNSPTEAPTTYAPSVSVTTDSPTVSPGKNETMEPTMASVPTALSTPQPSSYYLPTIASLPPFGGEPTTPLPTMGSIPSTPMPMETISTASPSSPPAIVPIPTLPPVTPTTSEPPVSLGLYPVEIQYGISSDCGITAYDVVNGIGNTITYGLITATEVVVIDILNTTFPRVEGEGGGAMRAILPHKIFRSGLLQKKARNSNKRKDRKRKNKDGSTRQLYTLSNAHEEANNERKLVYYSEENPIVISDVEDVSVQACPQGMNCMSVFSTVYVVLEEGDDPNAVESAIRDGVEESFTDGSFFTAIPFDTVFCPQDTLPPTNGTSPSPTVSPISSPLTTPQPSVVNITTVQPTESSVTTVSPSSSPISSPLTTPQPSDGQNVTTSPPSNAQNTTTAAPTTRGGSVGPLTVQITYDIANDCGLDAEAVMNEDGNTLKTGLIEATTITAIGILNSTFPRADGTRRQVRLRRGLAHLASTMIQTNYHHRNLVYYTDEYPVTIDRIIDMETGCAPGNNCLLIISPITVVLEPGDDADAVSTALTEGMSDSFKDGTFFLAIPEDTVICPERRRELSISFHIE